MTYAVELLGITKQFPGTLANQDVTVRVKPGEIRAIVGENGAGKSTLMNILYGIHQPTAGTIKVRGQEVRIANPRRALALGIGMIHQHFKLVPEYSIADNIVLGIEPKRFGLFYDRQAAITSTAEASARFGLKVDPHMLIRDASVGIQQRVEILKALYRGAEIVILDEPTAVLTPQETEEVFSVIRALAQQGKTIFVITHKLNEVMAISDRITVMRGGRMTGELETAQTNPKEIARLMVGRDVVLQVEKPPANRRGPALVIRDLQVNDDRQLLAVKGISLTVETGEILGIAGVEGNGQTELIEAITGLRPVEGGSVEVAGTPLANAGPDRVLASGTAHIPEDRNARGLSPDSPIWENLILGMHNRAPLARRGSLDVQKARHQAGGLVKEYQIKTADLDSPARSLSGGNQQKVVVARELSREIKVLVVSQPTRGVDIGAIEFIHEQIIRKRDEGVAILLVSAELTEVMSLSDRIAVIHNGRIVGVVGGGEKTEQEIGFMMLGADHAGVEVEVAP